MRILSLMALSVHVLALIACGADVESACREYRAAYIGCMKEVYDDPELEADLRGCDIHEGQSDEELFDSYNCKAAAWWWADCSTSKGYDEAWDEAATCR